MSEPTTSIQVTDLVKTYGTQRAVDGISFTLPTTGVIGFLGPNGAGKSTTLRVLAGYVQPTSGSALVAGSDIVNQRLAASRRIGYLAEHNPLYLDIYVAEYLRLAGSLQGMSGANLSGRIEEVIALTGLTAERHKRLGQLSKGYRQRAGLAQAILHRPKVLILDEPTSGLDPNQLVEIRELIRKLGQTSCVIFSSHILSEVQAVADRVLIIHQGRILLDAPMAEAQARLGARSLRLELAAEGFDTAALARVPGVAAVELLGPKQIRISLAADAEGDPRQQVFNEVVRQGHSLLSLSEDEENLEAIFRQLTR